MISLQRFNNSAVDEEDIMQPNNYVNTLIKKTWLVKYVFLWVTVMVLRILYTMTYDTVWYNIELKYPTVNQYMPYVTLSPNVSHVLVYRQTVNQCMPYVTLSPDVSHVLVYRQTQHNWIRTTAHRYVTTTLSDKIQLLLPVCIYIVNTMVSY